MTETVKTYTIRQLRDIAQSIIERDVRSMKKKGHNVQRLHHKEVELVCSALRGWANHIENDWKETLP